MNAMPFILLGLYALLVIAAGIVLDGLILFWLTEKFKIAEATLKKSLSIVCIAAVVAIVLLFIFYFVRDDTSRGIISLVFSIVIYLVLIAIFYRPPFLRSLGLTLSFVIVGGIANLLISATIILPVRLFVIQPLYVNGAGMEPTYRKGDYVLTQKVIRTFKRGDVIVFRYPPGEKKFLIKRIIGLPGETLEIKEGSAYSNGVKIGLPHISGSLRDSLAIVLKSDEYFVVGDNASVSFDSRIFGPIRKESIVGSVIATTDLFQEFLKKQQ